MPEQLRNRLGRATWPMSVTWRLLKTISWEQGFERMHVTPDALVALDPEHVLALVSITATPRGGRKSLSWAAAHIWTVRDGRIAGWETHVDFAAAQSTFGL